MTRWHQSGTRRDMCILLAEAGELRGQRLKSRLESHYDTQLDPKRFYSTLTSLVEAGHVEKRVEGLYDVYSLTDVGERRLHEQLQWMQEKVEHDGSE
ncbi:Transcriptional regulator PadR-like family protein [Haladaptatus litoreus]|uniref:Transcriptional regulator PadR-like family protein n=1 Tax=Haladaptatus litoreus TaxID=553468 RepID=A0A1N6YJZ4_9EURY|nr:helix-turn-helix transcriptional regulator [Haladaptatus litoreus]SIR14781.1 Transcriptional regulator PadR-like family protein [Haladaptatus litoreus]